MPNYAGRGENRKRLVTSPVYPEHNVVIQYLFPMKITLIMEMLHFPSQKVELKLKIILTYHQ